MTDQAAADLTHRGRWFRNNMPYAIRRDSGRWITLNRDYQPIGTMTFRADPAAIQGVWTGGDTDTLFLYDDGPASRHTYFQRFEKLMTLARVGS